ncbi:MAG: c-type cytochrome domain-containing protein [Planctomycetales bacterium]
MLPSRLALTACILFVASASTQAADEKITYTDHVQPIFRAKCFACHNPDKKSGGLDLTNYTAMKEGGSSGEVVDAGDADSSYLWLLVNHESEPYMPPKADKLPDVMLAVIKAWIVGGALDTKSSKAVVRPKAKMKFALSFGSTGRPDGPPPLPTRLSLQPVVHTERTTAVNSIATSPWAPLVAISGQKQILLYNTQTLELAGTLPFPEGEPHVLQFSRSGHLLLAGGGQGAAAGRVVVFNVMNGERIFEIGDELDAVMGADISSDHKYIALGGPQKVVRVYSTETSEVVYEIRKHTDWISAVSFSPDGVLLATGDRNGGVFVWEADTGREYLGLKGHTKRISGFSWRADSNVVASASEDASVRLWEMENGKQIKSWGAHGGGTASVDFTRDGEIVTAGRDKTVKLWKGDGAAIRTFEAFGDLALATAYCDETKRVVGGDWTGLVRVWNAADGKRLAELSTNPITLESRLALAQADVGKVAADQKAKQAAYTAAQAKVTAATTQLAAGQKKLADATTQEKTLAAKLVVDQKTAADAKVKLDASAKIVTTLQPLVPLLKDAVAKADLAVQKAAGDQDVVKAAAQLKAVTVARDGSLVAATKTVAAETARMNTTNAAVAAGTKTIAATKAVITATQTAVTKYTATLAAEQKNAAASKVVLDAANAAATKSQQAVARWQNEIQFTQKLTVLQTQQKQFEELEIAFLDVDAELKVMLAKVTQAQTAVTAAQQVEKTSTDGVAATKQKLTQVTADKTAQVAMIAAREKAVPMLKEAVDKGAAAVAALPADKELAAAAAQIKAASDRNIQMVAQLKVKVVALDKSLVAVQAEVVASEQKLLASKTVTAAATKKLKEEQAATAPVQTKLTAAKQAFDQGRASLDLVKQEVDGLRQQASVPTAAPSQG